MKDLDADLLQHLAQGTAFLQVSTKAHPNGEMRGRVGPHQAGHPHPPPLLPVAGWHCLEQGGRAQDRSVTRSQRYSPMCFVVMGGSFASPTTESSQAWALEVTSCSLPPPGAHSQPVPGRRDPPSPRGVPGAG